MFLRNEKEVQSLAANRRYIKRSVTLSACTGQRIGELGEFEDYCDVLVGDYTPERATRVLRRLHGDQSITILNVEKETAKYAMTIEDFISNAQRED